MKFDTRTGISRGVDSMNRSRLDCRGRTRGALLRLAWPDLAPTDHLVLLRLSDFETIMEATRGQPIFEIGAAVALKPWQFKWPWLWLPRWFIRLSKVFE